MSLCLEHNGLKNLKVIVLEKLEAGLSCSGSIVVLILMGIGVE